ncbi:uncharacterized protein LOC125194758 [Salvia hispanica]|uniref:uncharacterized protein LOC125194758 n=1 Tax=Salvia hispanica TaxID=49212 RepID=UPI00200988E0|nr:uncharacterized protein LOC125194758 [Salvia hispanica]
MLVEPGLKNLPACIRQQQQLRCLKALLKMLLGRIGRMQRPREKPKQIKPHQRVQPQRRSARQPKGNALRFWLPRENNPLGRELLRERRANSWIFHRNTLQHRVRA